MEIRVPSPNKAGILIEGNATPTSFLTDFVADGRRKNVDFFVHRNVEREITKSSTVGILFFYQTYPVVNGLMLV